MKNAKLIGAVALVATTTLVACERRNDTRVAAADNSARNVRDRDGDTLTADDQGGSEGDRAITQKIRQAVVDDETLSVNGHNVKIITVNGAVTLRGPVASAQERDRIAAMATQIAGAGKVHNQLEIAHN
jgi:osmotically-inducible protein OsmY